MLIDVTGVDGNDDVRANFTPTLNSRTSKNSDFAMPTLPLSLLHKTIVTMNMIITLSETLRRLRIVIKYVSL